MKLTTALRSAIAQEIIAALSAGSEGDSVIEIYTGSVPSSMGGTISTTLLATCTMAATPATETDGVITFNDITDDDFADDSGTAGWARVLDKDGAEVVYLTVTGSGGGGDIELNTTTIAAGGPVAITSGTITVGGA